MSLRDQLEAAATTVENGIRAEEECTKRAILERIVQDPESPKFGQWDNYCRQPNDLEQLQRIVNGEKIPDDELAPVVFGCKHIAAHKFAEAYGKWAANQLLGEGDAPPISQFRITELPEGE